MKLFLAGVSSRMNLERLDDVKYVLESYYVVRSRPEMIKKIKNKQWEVFLLDSGAYSFLAKQVNGHDVKIDWDKYVDDYIDFINKYDVDNFFELDIDSVVGLKEVERLRRKLEKGTGKKCIPVWHVSRGKEYFIKMCKEYSYIAFGGILTDGVATKKILEYLPWFTKTAHKYGCKIHGLGLTCKGIEKLGLDTADSTSWLSGGRFGSLHQFDGKGIKSVTFKDKRAKHYMQIDRHNLEQWIKYQKYLEQF